MVFSIWWEIVSDSPAFRFDAQLEVGSGKERIFLLDDLLCAGGP
jgi:hypothetical protein